ncbi:MAG: mannitol dehydrogenase family protein [Ruthenibacterium sp.]
MAVTLNKASLADKAAWAAAGISLPSYDYGEMRAETQKNPRWVHVGAGNIFRAYIADLAQQLLEKGEITSGITALSTFDHQILSKIYDPCDDLSLQVIMHADGKLDKKVIASVGETLKADASDPAGWARAKEIFRTPELAMISFTITEKGYHIRNMQGEFYPAVEEDFMRKTDVPQNGMSIIAALLLERFLANAAPIAVVSMDNFSHNGDKLYDSIRTIAEKWVENGKAPQAFAAYLADRSKVAFPCSMIDKITPRPDDGVAKALRESGFDSTDAVITDKNTYIAPFVNAEAPQYLVIEDCFPNGRPRLEDVGVYIVSRETVDLMERMKVCTCLNPLHTALAVCGCLLGYTSIAAEMKDADLVKMVETIGYKEGMPVVANPGIVNPNDFLNEVLSVRLPNPYIPDTPQRIATDTSQKLGIRYGETIKLYRASATLDTADLHCIPFAIAAWCRYLLGVDDSGNAFAPSADPLLCELQEILAGVTLGNPASGAGKLQSILSNTRIFGMDLYADGLGKQIETYFTAMLAGTGAVRATLHDVVAHIE